MDSVFIARGLLFMQRMYLRVKPASMPRDKHNLFAEGGNVIASYSEFVLRFND